MLWERIDAIIAIYERVFRSTDLQYIDRNRHLSDLADYLLGVYTNSIQENTIHLVEDIRPLGSI
jgi:hypothetical protein